MAAFRCSLCEDSVRPHCPDGRCGWWTCGNDKCDAVRYDVWFGWMLRKDGTVERLGAPS